MEAQRLTKNQVAVFARLAHGGDLRPLGRSITSLVKRGLLEVTDAGYQITESGSQALLAEARFHGYGCEDTNAAERIAGIERLLAAAEAREKVLREACRPVAEWLAASLALREAECEEDCPDRRILAAVDKYAVTVGDARAIALALTTSPATALEAAIEQARAEERAEILCLLDEYGTELKGQFGAPQIINEAIRRISQRGEG